MDARIIALSMVFLLPLASAQEAELCVILFEPSADFQELHAFQDLILDDAARMRMAENVDQQHGNGDGRVAADEVAAYEHARKQEFRNNNNLGRFALTIDGNAPTRVVQQPELRDFVGPVSEPGHRELRMHYDYDFPATYGAERVVRGGNAQDPDCCIVEEFVIIKAPSGWHVAAVNGEAFNAPEVQLPQFTTWNQYSMKFEKQPLAGTSAEVVVWGGIGLAVAAAAIGAATWIKTRGPD